VTIPAWPIASLAGFPFSHPSQERLVHKFALASALAVVLAAPLARADIGIRAGLEAPLVTHSSAGSISISDGIAPALDVLLSYYPAGIIGFDIEGREGFAGTGNWTRTGTAIGPGITINPPIIPLYLRASLPIHFEPGDVTFGLRAATGLSINLLILSIYLEGAVDFPLAGNNVTAFNVQTFSLGGGVWFKF
jgi:hypothetical protein